MKTSEIGYPSDETREFEVSKSENNFRLDLFLKTHLSEISRSYLQTLIEQNHVKINGIICIKASKKLKDTQKITVYFPVYKKIDLLAQPADLDIVFEDEFLLVVNKSPGIMVHPASGIYRNTLVNFLLYHCKDNLSAIRGELKPGIVHRLDKDTSGLMLVAKRDLSHTRLSEMFAARQIYKEYVAVVYGLPSPTEATINIPLARDPKNRFKMIESKNGKNAITHYKTIKNYNMAASLLEITIETGRTHQIRAHLEILGNPIIGDAFYKKFPLNRPVSKFAASFPRQALHARSLGFKHPISDVNYLFTTSLPTDIKELIGSL